MLYKGNRQERKGRQALEDNGDKGHPLLSPKSASLSSEDSGPLGVQRSAWLGVLGGSFPSGYWVVSDSRYLQHRLYV